MRSIEWIDEDKLLMSGYGDSLHVLNPRDALTANAVQCSGNLPPSAMAGTTSEEHRCVLIGNEDGTVDVCMGLLYDHYHFLQTCLSSDHPVITCLARSKIIMYEVFCMLYGMCPHLATVFRHTNISPR